MHKKIVVVEDDPAIRNMYKLKLESSGLNVRVAEDGKQGLTVIEEFLPDMILLDLRMPVMSGDEMLQHIRATDWGHSIRVVVLTNISRDEAPHALRLLNIDRYIVKAHHTPSQVLDIVNEILNTPTTNAK